MMVTVSPSNGFCVPLVAGGAVTAAVGAAIASVEAGG